MLPVHVTRLLRPPSTPTSSSPATLPSISVWEPTFAAHEIIERTLAVFTVLGLAAVFYFVICFGMDRVGRHVEGRLMVRGFAGERR